jgi:fructokinase
MQDKPFIAFGEAVWDVFPDKKRLGGAPLNFSYYFQKAGGNPIVITALGRDENGKEALEHIKNLGLTTRYIEFNDKPTGTVKITMPKNSKKHKFTIIKDVACEYISYPKDKELVKNAIGLYFGVLTRLPKGNREVINKLMTELKDKTILLDLNLRQNLFNKEDIKFLLGKVNYLKLNDDEARALVEMGLAKGTELKEILRFLIKTYQLKACCITLGSQGAVGGDEKQIIKVPGILAKEGGDSVGAGDSFAATWIASLLQGKTLKESVEKANEVGSKVASKKGAIVDT